MQYGETATMAAARHVNTKTSCSRRDYSGQAGFTLIRNQNKYIAVGNGKRILLTGLDNSMLGHAYIPDSTKIYKSDYDILLTYKPDKADEYQNCDYDLIFIGHSHKVQINIPFLPFINEKAVSVISLSAKYAGGMYSPDPSGAKECMWTKA